MPELPEIETIKTELNEKALKQRISAVEVSNPKILKGINNEALNKALTGSEFTHCGRHGKLFLLETDQHQCLAVHLGLRGKLRYVAKPNAKTHGQIIIRFENNTCMTYTTLFGNMALTDSPDAAIELNTLGPDALDISAADFKKRIQDYSGNIKSFLMDQHNMAGLGNIYTDELLFQTRLDPRTPCQDLSPAKLKDMFATMRNMLKTAIDSQAEWSKLPDSYLTVHRRADQKCPHCGRALKTAKVAGRTCYYCAHCQKQTA